MSEFFGSIKSDLLSRRLLPLLALLGVALFAAGAYALKSGSSSSSPTETAGGQNAAAAANHSGALAVAAATANPNQAVSETPGGTRYQSKGSNRDPFAPLPGATSASTSTPATSSSSKTPSSSAGSSGSSTGGSGTSKNSSPAPTPAKPAKPVKPPFPYIVAVLFGVAPTEASQPTTLTPFENLTLGQPLPSKTDVRVRFQRVTGSAEGAVFKLVVPPILHGPGLCLPNAAECQAIDLAVGQAEVLEYVEASGQVVGYELKLVSVSKKSATAGSARVRHKAHAAQVNRKARTAVIMSGVRGSARGSAGAAQVIGSASSIHAVSR